MVRFRNFGIKLYAALITLPIIFSEVKAWHQNNPITVIFSLPT